MGNALVDVRILQREYLLAISRAMTAELDIHDLLRLILQASVELVAGKAGMIVLADEHEEGYQVASVYGIPPHLVDHFAPLVRGLPTAEEGGEKEVIAELTRRLGDIASKVDLGLTQVLRLPLISGGSVIGLIYVFQSGSYYFVDDARALLRSFAEQAAIAVKNARLYAQVNMEKQRLDAILEHSADGVMLLNPSLEVTAFNAALSRMTGWAAEDVYGRLHHDVIRWHSLKTTTDLLTARSNGWPLPGAANLYVEGEFLRVGVNGKPASPEIISLGITYAPLQDENGRVTDIIGSVRDLTRYREEEELQKTFISVVSHELKTPVSIIKGYAGTLRRQDANWSPEIVDESLAVIEEEADNLTELIDNLLEVSRLQAGTFNLELSDEVMLDKVAASVARRYTMQTSKHQLRVHFPEKYPTIIGDQRRLTQVLNNLVSNAIKYSPDGGTILISGAAHPEHVTISIQDSGIGIPAHEQHRIFQKFSRLDNALSRKTEGTGLGLFLSKAIVEAHNGRIWFNNNSDTEADSSGTTFTFSLPRHE